jgi:hypothetical protein
MALMVAVLFALLQGAKSSQSGADTAQAIRDTQLTNRTLLHRLEHLQKRIQSCTTPGKPCANRGARATAAAIDTLSTRNAHTAAVASSAAAACSIDNHGYQAIYVCVVQRLAVDQSKKGTP